MANQITGRIYKIMPTQSIVSERTGNTFYKREIVLDASRFDQYTGEKKFDNSTPARRSSTTTRAWSFGAMSNAPSSTSSRRASW